MSAKTFDPTDPYTRAMMEHIQSQVYHVTRDHGGEPNTVMIPMIIWENLGRPMRLVGLKVIPFDDLCKKPMIWVGNTPEELRL